MTTLQLDPRTAREGTVRGPCSPLVAHVYRAAVVLAGITLLVLVGRDPNAYETDVDGFVLAMMMLAVLVGQTVTVKRVHRRGEVAPSRTFVFALLLTGGPAVAIVSQFAASVIAGLREREAPGKIAFNASQYVIALFLSSLVLVHLTDLSRPAHFDLVDLPGLVLGGAVFYGCNIGAVAIDTALRTELPLRRQFDSDLAFHGLTEVILLGLAPLALLAVDYSPAVLPLLVLPLVAINRAGRQAVVNETLALRDSLTGLPNRVLFRDRAELALSGARRRGGGVSIMLMDLDRFKEINDTLGHHMGDEVLLETARRLLAGLRESDTVARLGGDEFAILVEAGPVEALAIGEALRDRIAETMDVEGVALAIDASVGIVSYPEHGEDFESLLQRADVAMYQAKGSEVRVVSYSSEGDDNSLARLTMAVRLREAIEKGTIEVRFQPQFSSRSGTMVGVEALARWDSPDARRVSTEDFIAVAEQTGLIVPLTRYVVRASVRQLAAWRAQGIDLTVAINLSPRALRRADLPELLAETTRRWDVPASSLVMEITESMVASDPRTTIPIVHELARAGAAISIDDFGTGFSSLEYLKVLPVDELKIDRSFVLGMRGDSRDAAIVQSAIELGHRLGLRVVAEGVEHAEARAQLTLMSCDLLQGYYFSPAVGADGITRLHAAGAVGDVPERRSA